VSERTLPDTFLFLSIKSFFFKIPLVVENEVVQMIGKIGVNGLNEGIVTIYGTFMKTALS
jgi:hypothetical protein